MADIRTRQTNKGTIRTIDRMQAFTSHMKDVQTKTKEQTMQQPGQEGDQASSRAQDQMAAMTRRSAGMTVRLGYDTAKAGQRIREKRKEVMQRQAGQGMADAAEERGIKSIRIREPKSRSAFAPEGKRVIGRPESMRRPAGRQAAMVKTLSQKKAVSRRHYQMTRRSQQAARQSRRAAKKLIRSLKAAIESTKALVTTLSAGGAIALVIILVFVLFGAAFYTFGDDSSDNYIPVSAEVEAYTPVISRYAQEYGIGEYVELIKAVMMQESGGRGTDPMQCSESPYNKRYAHAPGSIKDPEYSIRCGIQYLADCLKQARCKSPVDMSNIRLALQGYNFGNGYIPWAIKRDGGYTVENAAIFSDMQAKKHGWSGYGDKQYPAHVLRYYPYGSYNIGVGNTAIVKVAQQQIGNHGGRKFWSWYGFGSRESWCGCFVSWCADQCGYIKSGTIPKFSYVPSIVDWAKSHHQWQTRNYKPAPGDIIVIDWYANGTRDHVGIVESCDGKTVHTIEGNRTDQVGRGAYAVGSGTIYGYFVPTY